MATKDWQTTSVRLTKDETNALKFLYERESISKNKFVKKMILEAIDPILHPGVLPEGQGIPKVGEHHFRYDSEKDTFTWQIDLGTQGIHILCEDISFRFLDSLKKRIDESLREREKIVDKIKEKPIIPKKIMKFKVK